VLVSLAAFGVYAALGYPLTAAVAFPSLALLNLLRFPIVMIPTQVGLWLWLWSGFLGDELAALCWAAAAAAERAFMLPA